MSVWTLCPAPLSSPRGAWGKGAPPRSSFPSPPAQPRPGEEEAPRGAPARAPHAAVHVDPEHTGIGIGASRRGRLNGGGRSLPPPPPESELSASAQVASGTGGRGEGCACRVWRMAWHLVASVPAFAERRGGREGEREGGWVCPLRTEGTASAEIQADARGSANTSLRRITQHITYPRVVQAGGASPSMFEFHA